MRETAAPAKPAFEAGHLATVALVIVPQKVQEPVQSQDPQLRLKRVPHLLRLPPGGVETDGEISEMAPDLLAAGYRLPASAGFPPNLHSRSPKPGAWSR